VFVCVWSIAESVSEVLRWSDVSLLSVDDGIRNNVTIELVFVPYCFVMARLLNETLDRKLIIYPPEFHKE
jgi:hypothetical protein